MFANGAKLAEGVSAMVKAEKLGASVVDTEQTGTRLFAMGKAAETGAMDGATKFKAFGKTVALFGQKSGSMLKACGIPKVLHMR